MDYRAEAQKTQMSLEYVVGSETKGVVKIGHVKSR